MPSILQRYHDVYPEFVMPEAQWQAFATTRTAMIAGRQVANQYHWKVGQHIPISSNIYPQKNGSKAWAFDLVGIFDGKDEDWQKQTNQVLINHDYFDEANQFGKGRANFFLVKLTDGKHAEAVTKTIDAMFENSPDETKTQTEKDFNLSFVKQIGDIGLIVRWILFAVFFTLLLVVGNTMAQSVRERIPELAVLKTLGFSDGSVLGFVFAEAFALCLFGGIVGLILATLAGAMVTKGSGGQFQLQPTGWVWLDRPRRHRPHEHRRGAAAGAARAAAEDRRCPRGPLSDVRRACLAEPDLAITGINIRSIPERWASSLVIVIGLAGVVAVFTALLAMAGGFEQHPEGHRAQ